MTPAALLAQFRTEMADSASPYLWADAEAYTYMDEAQKQFARELGGFPDSLTTALTQVAITVNLASFNLDERVLKIRGAYRASDGRQVKIVNYEDMDKLGMRFDGRTGPLAAIIIGMDETNVVPWPVPSVADTLKLIVDRLPLADIATDGSTVAFDAALAPQHHIKLLHWMKHRAYEKQDAETFDKSKSKEFEAKFYAACEKARKEKDRRKHKTRVVAYGGLATRAPVSREDMDY